VFYSAGLAIIFFDPHLDSEWGYPMKEHAFAAKYLICLLLPRVLLIVHRPLNTRWHIESRSSPSMIFLSRVFQGTGFPAIVYKRVMIIGRNNVCVDLPDQHL
jgi:hypothetical protein